MAALKTHQDYLYKFYASLVRQRPNSKMAIAWLLKHGYDEDLLPMAYLSINPMSKKIQKPKAKLLPVKKAVQAAEIDKELKAQEKPAKAEKPASKAEKTAKPAKAEKPAKPAKAEKPAKLAKAEKSAAKTDKPAAKPEKPAAKAEKKPMKCKTVKMETD